MNARDPNNISQNAVSAETTQGNTGKDQAKQSASEVAGQTKQAAAQVTDQAKQAAKTQASTRKDQAAQGLNVVSSAVQEMGDKLRQNDQTSSYAGYVDQAANQIQRFSGYLREHDVGEITNRVEDWMRRDPVLTLGGAFVLGLVAARFLKSSGIQTRSSNRPGTRYTPTYRYGNQYYRYDGSPGYYAPDRAERWYGEEEFRSPATDIEGSRY